MSLNKDQFRSLISRVLHAVELGSSSAIELLMLTAAAESRLGEFLRQQGGGPALGAFQMEPATERDIWDNYLQHRPALKSDVLEMSTGRPGELEWNLGYAILMARVHYLRVKWPLPDAYDVDAMAAYWKSHYNTSKGAGDALEAAKAYRRLC